MNGDIQDRRFRAVLSEHQITRQEITATNGRKASLVQFFLLFLFASYGYVLPDERIGFLPIIGIGSTAFFAAWLFEHELVILLSTYLRDEIEANKFPKLLSATKRNVL